MSTNTLFNAIYEYNKNLVHQHKNNKLQKKWKNIIKPSKKKIKIKVKPKKEVVMYDMSKEYNLAEEPTQEAQQPERELNEEELKKYDDEVRKKIEMEIEEEHKKINDEYENETNENKSKYYWVFWNNPGWRFKSYNAFLEKQRLINDWLKKAYEQTMKLDPNYPSNPIYYTAWNEAEIYYNGDIEELKKHK